MINERIEILRKKLNTLVAENADYEEIYEVSKQIDECIVEYYKTAKPQ